MDNDGREPAATLAGLLARATADDAELTARRTRARELVAQLTPLETKLLAKLAAGWSGRDIAADLGIAETAYDRHRAGLFAKISAQSITGAVRIAIYAGLT